VARVSGALGCSGRGASAAFTGEKRRRVSYQEIDGVEANTVAKSASLRRSGALVIARRSCSDGRRDPVEDELVVLGHEKKNYHVWEVRTGEGEVVVQTRE
jgi:hypothetical protein